MSNFETALRKLWPHGDQKIPGLIDAMVQRAPVALSAWGIGGNLLAQQHLMAQVSHECGAGHDVVESLFYTTAQRICAVWPSRFPDLLSAQAFVRNEPALAIKVYGDRMGNHPGSRDGYNFRGRGGCQVTGRDGYKRLDDVVHLGLLDDPDLVNDPLHFLLCAAAEFSLCGCVPYANRDDVVGVSAVLNVGHLVKETKIVGMAERREWLARWKAEMTIPVPVVTVTKVPPLVAVSVPPLAPLPAPAPSRAPAQLRPRAVAPSKAPGSVPPPSPATPPAGFWANLASALGRVVSRKA